MNPIQTDVVDVRDSRHLATRYARIRGFSEALCETLTAEDCVIQSMPDVSPTRWHLAHTTWFFETFVLGRAAVYRPYDEQFAYLFNSYYNSVGKQFPRPQRGSLSRPTLAEILAYRSAIDERMLDVMNGNRNDQDTITPIIELGLQHEQQHQELILTDIKHVLSCNPLLPSYRSGDFSTAVDQEPDEWLDYEEGIHWIGHEGDGFAYDNESPRHRKFLEAFQIGSRPVTCGQYLEFMHDGGYGRPELWLSAGWQQRTDDSWQAPLYWYQRDGDWHEFTLAGPVNLDTSRPVCHVSYFEADAYARWAGARLPTEAEWEVAGFGVPIEGNFADQLLPAGAAVHPSAQPVGRAAPARMFGDVWEWTASQYSAYPGYRPTEGALGEYNGKFMCNQFVLRGASCATSQDHVRATYRNFFPPDARWQFSGFRMAR